ncbi:MAG TPA: hypothetical protein GXX29_02730 [Firmicutes bacterium]|nr:hypothetical protein [Bacillota bacterium]
MANRSKASSIDEYIAEFPSDIQKVLQKIRSVIKEAVPDAIETISYAMPTFDLNGKHLVHFAAHAKHIGFYPTPSAIEQFRSELGPYKFSKGAVQFPLDQLLPLALMRKMVEFRVHEVRKS